MTPVFSVRRRANDFEALLSRAPEAPLTERDAARFAALMDVVSDLRSVPEVAPRPEFASALRERLMAEADTVLVRQPSTPTRLAMPATSSTRERRFAALVGGVALVGATATMAVAAQTSLPGESLYGVKRGIESAQVRLATDEAGRGRTLLAQAGNRLTELEGLAAGKGGNDRLIPDTLDDFTEQAGDGVRTLLAAYGSGGAQQDAQDARDFTATSMARLTALQLQLPASARDELLAAGRTLSDLDLEISSACRSCSGGVATTPDFLLSSGPTDLLTGLDSDELTLEPAPVSGQDVSGITIPDALQSPTLSTPAPQATSTPTPGVVTPDPTKPQKIAPDKVKDITKGVTETPGELTSGLDGATGGAIGGLTSGVDNATGGLIGEVTGTLDGATGGAVDGLTGNATGGLLP